MLPFDSVGRWGVGREQEESLSKAYQYLITVCVES